MSSITSAPTTAVASLADTYSAFDLGNITSPRDLIQAFNIFKLDRSGIRDINEDSQRFQTPPLAELVASTHIRGPINDKTFKIDLEKLADDISAMDISRPARRSAKRPIQAHPYKRPALTKAEKILSNHGMVKKGAPVVQAMFSPGQIKSVASKPCIKMNNATLSLLSNASSPPDMFDSPFNWSTAWLSRGCATSTPAPPIETQVYVSPATNAYNKNCPMEEIVVSVPTIVKERKPSKDTGKTQKSRLPKCTPYSKEKEGRKKKVIKAEPVISKFDAEVASLADMLSHCRLNNASTINARLTRSRARAARKAEACHDSGYEGGHED